jgi:hypothetical protein
MKKFLISLFLISSLYLVAQTPVRIVCLGNSITHGKIDKPSNTIVQLSYRPCLWEMLDSAGVNVDMVGYYKLWFDESPTNLAPTPVSKHTGHVFDRDHDSYYGAKSYDLLYGNQSSGWTGSPLPKLSDRLKYYTPDIALVHIGSNDPDSILNKTVLNIETIIDELRTKNPKVIVFVAKVITVWRAINTKVDQIAADKNTEESPVIAVDLATGFINDPANPNTMTFDWVHPNPKGQRFMADRWYKAIQNQLNKGTGFSENLQDKVEVYPSISSGIIRIKSSANAQIQIVNALGRAIKSLKVTENISVELDLSNFVDGLYVVNINQDGRTVSKKIILNKR